MTYEFAEDVNYWKTGSGGIEAWKKKIRKELEEVGGIWGSFVFGEQEDPEDGESKSVFQIQFILDEDPYRIVWPVLRSKSGNDSAAQRQAITALYHTVKAKCVELKFLGARQAFYSNLVLPDGRTAAQLLPGEVTDRIPKLLTHIQD